MNIVKKKQVFLRSEIIKLLLYVSIYKCNYGSTEYYKGWNGAIDLIWDLIDRDEEVIK